MDTVTAMPWLDWKRACHQLLNVRIQNQPTVAGTSQRGSLHAALAVLLDHCSSGNAIEGGRLVCWPAIESDSPGRGLDQWLGHEARYVRELVGKLHQLGVIGVRHGPTSRASVKHKGSIVLNGTKHHVGRSNVYVINLPFTGTVEQAAATTATAADARTAARPRPVPLQPRSTKAGRWWVVGNLPDLPKPLREEWSRTKGRDRVTLYLKWLDARWGERRTDTDDPFEFHKDEWELFRRSAEGAARAATAQQQESATQQQVRERLEKRAGANG